MSILRGLCLTAALAVLLAGAYSTAASQTPSAAMDSSVSDAARGTARGYASTVKESTADNAAEDARYADTVLEDLKATYTYLDGVTVSIGTTPRGEQAVAYYTNGQILISPAHTASIDTILAHEIWHIIDWRDNGRLDWGEDLPPDNSSAYVAR